MEYFGLSATGAPTRPAATVHCSASITSTSTNCVSPARQRPDAEPAPGRRDRHRGRLSRRGHRRDRQDRGQVRLCAELGIQPPHHPQPPRSISSGPVRGHALMVTKFSPAGTKTRGTLNNCGTGKTPWGTLLTGEENWAGYFFRAARRSGAARRPRQRLRWPAMAATSRHRGRGQPLRLGDRRQRRQVRALEYQRQPAPRPTAATTIATRSTARATWSRSIPTTPRRRSRSAPRSAAWRTRAPPSRSP